MAKSHTERSQTEEQKSVIVASTQDKRIEKEQPNIDTTSIQTLFVSHPLVELTYSTLLSLKLTLW